MIGAHAAEGAVSAWRTLRLHPDYRMAWRAVAAGTSRAQPGSIPIRRQTEGGLAAAAWGLLAWEDPLADGGPVSPFRANAPMVEGMQGLKGTPSFASLAKARGVVRRQHLIASAEPTKETACVYGASTHGPRLRRRAGSAWSCTACGWMAARSAGPVTGPAWRPRPEAGTGRRRRPGNRRASAPAEDVAVGTEDEARSPFGLLRGVDDGTRAIEGSRCLVFRSRLADGPGPGADHEQKSDPDGTRQSWNGKRIGRTARSTQGSTMLAPKKEADWHSGDEHGSC